ncbi:MAG TPA: DUF4112 domain-containing protein [Gemmatimonadales bacterium]|nr:DUF4112 domain-containing protein [Gemmatimonadales bacterium]
MPGRDVARHGVETRHLDRLRAMARVWDDLFRIPVIGTRIGLDALIGLIPGVGDVAGALVASWGLVVAATLRAPISILGRMLMNIGIDAVVGVIPLVGDAFDIGWRAQRRNLALLDRWVESPGKTERRSLLALGSVAIGLVSIMVGALWVAVRVLTWVLSLG